MNSERFRVYYKYYERGLEVLAMLLRCFIFSLVGVFICSSALAMKKDNKKTLTSLSDNLRDSVFQFVDFNTADRLSSNKNFIGFGPNQNLKNKKIFKNLLRSSLYPEIIEFKESDVIRLFLVKLINPETESPTRYSLFCKKVIACRNPYLEVNEANQDGFLEKLKKLPFLEEIVINPSTARYFITQQYLQNENEINIDTWPLLKKIIVKGKKAAWEENKDFEWPAGIELSKKRNAYIIREIED